MSAGKTGSGYDPPKGVRVEVDPKTGLPVVVAVADAPGTALIREELMRLEQDSLYLEDLRRIGIPLKFVE